MKPAMTFQINLEAAHVCEKAMGHGPTHISTICQFLEEFGVTPRIHKLRRGNNHEPLRHEHYKYHVEYLSSPLMQLESDHLQKSLVAELEREIGMLNRLCANNENSETAPYDIERASDIWRGNKTWLGWKSAIWMKRLHGES